MQNFTAAELTVGQGAVPRDVIADDIIEISDEMLIELWVDDRGGVPVPPPIPTSS